MEPKSTMESTFRDPVCGMDVTRETAAATSEYQGQTYYFCSPGCKRGFDMDPERYAGQNRSEMEES